jgi:hypothetical protein
MSSQEEKMLVERIDWLKQKLAEQRNPDSTVSGTPLLIGRTEGNIGALEWVLREFRKAKAR